ncbi:AraC family transcriptional regulator [uncultured Psychroserpens sp.]|uniref:helix-turn-helix domain-containing protein n=1 Tax=uncultured Psychroserpens sp. TaxID=255436 RepID=UPI0026390477|nr:AraC family transcriptional regulator [uncultured Psychroserpens sp.]
MYNESLIVKQYPSRFLKQYISNIYIYHFKSSNKTLLHPKGVFEMVIQGNSDIQHSTSYSDGWETRPKNFIGGLHSKSYYVKPEKSNNLSVISVEFKPDATKYFIPEKLNRFQNKLVELSQIWNDSNLLISRIEAAKTDTERVNCIENFLKSKVENRKDSTIDKVLQYIHNSNGFIEVGQLLDVVKLSSSQFRKRFNEEIGTSPSQYCKIQRANTSLKLLKDKSYNSLTGLAYDLGYFDQSHFIKDFKSVIGFSPKQIYQLYT